MAEVYNVASSILQQRLSQTPGVGQVMIGGSSLPGIRIEIDPAEHGVEKIDLGGEWKAMTGLPFVYAMWVGRPGAVTPAQAGALQQARNAGVMHFAEIAREWAGGDASREVRAFGYLRDNLKYELGPREQAGLSRFHALAAEIGVVPGLQPLRFYESDRA